MMYTWVFMCNLVGGCGAIIKITSQRYDGHNFINCPVCHRNACLQRKE